MVERFVSFDTRHSTAIAHALWHSHFRVLCELAIAKHALGQTNWKPDLYDSVMQDLEALVRTPDEGDPALAAELAKHISDDARRSAAEVVAQAFDRVLAP